MKTGNAHAFGPIDTFVTLGGGGGEVSSGASTPTGYPPSGQIPTANGSNGWAWGSNVAKLTADSSNSIVGPFVNLAAGSNVNFTFDGAVGSVPSNTIRIHAQISGPGGSGAPTDIDYLVGTSDGRLSNEIAVGTTPGGELGGTWASPTVDTVHSGSSHASLRAFAFFSS